MDGHVDQKTPLFVDLDGTFIKSDTLFESSLIAVKQNPFVIFKLLRWLIKGKIHLKNMLSQYVQLPVDSLPLNQEFYSFLQGEKGKREIILSTASPPKYASEFVNEYEVLSSFISSTEHTNLKGKKKLKQIQKLTNKFSYAGNSHEDCDIFPFAEECFLVNPTTKAKRRSSNLPITKIFDHTPLDFNILLKQIRIHQWLKNLLIFVALLVSGSYTDPQLIMLSMLGFISFGCLASATYIINDLFDLDSDRLHKTKRNRPLAAGLISIPNAITIAIVLIIFSSSLAFTISKLFFYALLAYFVGTLTYSFKIKKHFGMDVIFLAALYTMRILSGAAILNIPVSFWLLSFSMFIFFSLALVKRCAELRSLAEQNKTETSGRDYTVNDYDILAALGISSGLLSILMFCFFTQSEALTNQYQEPSLIWLIIPALGYWLTRMWVKTHRGEMHEDPIVFSMKDKGSVLTISFMVLLTILGKNL